MPRLRPSGRNEGKTKTGKPTYFFARDVGAGVLAQMPEGFEATESINGVVSVRRKKSARVMSRRARSRCTRLPVLAALAGGCLVQFESYPVGDPEAGSAGRGGGDGGGATGAGRGGGSGGAGTGGSPGDAPSFDTASPEGGASATDASLDAPPAGASGLGGAAGIDAGDSRSCTPLGALQFFNGGFESGQLEPGWTGALATVTASAARSGAWGLLFAVTSPGYPIASQKVEFLSGVARRRATVTAWTRLVSLPSMRLLVWANRSDGVHVGSGYRDATVAGSWQELSVSVMIPDDAEHLEIILLGPTQDLGAAYWDDVVLCLDDGSCSDC
jgi:hypothetical protein